MHREYDNWKNSEKKHSVPFLLGNRSFGEAVIPEAAAAVISHANSNEKC